MGQLKSNPHRKINTPNEAWKLAKAITLSARILRESFKAERTHNWEIYEAFMAAAGKVAGPQNA